MEKENVIISAGGALAGRSFALVMHLKAIQAGLYIAPPKDHKAELIEYIKATGYTFDLEPDKLADYLISECDNFNFNNRTSFDYSEFFQLYLNEHPQYRKDMGMPFKGLLAIDEIKTTFTGKSLKAVSIKLGDFNFEAQKAKYNNNQKWYNQFQNKRRKR